MKEWLLQRSTIYGMISLSFAVGLGLYNWVCWSLLTATDWGTWFGALGTIGALIGAIWLATAERRRREEDALDIARLVAAKISGELKILIDRTDLFLVALAFTAEESFDIEHFLRSGGLFDENRAIKPFSDLVQLAPLPNNPAARIARGIGMLQIIYEEVQGFRTNKDWQQVDSKSRISLVKSWREVTHEAATLLVVAQRECIAAAAIAAPSPTHQEIYGDD